MRVIFAGTPDFAAVHLQSLIDNDDITVAAVYTQPDRPSGRGKKLKPSAVKTLALSHGLNVSQPAKFDTHKSLSDLTELKADIMVVVAYGLILPKSVLATPALGCINVHASILPKWRGAAPIQRAIEAGDTETGVTVIQMDSGLDTGIMLTVSRCEIQHDDTSDSLHKKLARLGAEALRGTLNKLRLGTAIGVSQVNDGSSYAHKIEKAEALIHWATPASAIALKIRAFNPFPTSFSTIGKHRLKIWTANALNREAVGVEGEIISATAEGLLVKCSKGCLLIKEVQLEGKSRMLVREILKSKSLLFSCGTVLGV